MKYLLFFFLYFLQVTCLLAQEHFVISGTTSLSGTGKIILVKNAPDEFYSLKLKKDTVNITDHKFQFEGSIKYPQQFRILFINSQEKYITQPFFIDTGVQKIFIDSVANGNDILDFGVNISVEGSKTNYEYTKKYLPSFDSINKKVGIFFSEINKCDSINDNEIKKACIIKSERDRLALRKSRDSILFSYATLNPKSTILSWLLYLSIRKYGYNEYYQGVYDLITDYTPSLINNSIITFLNKQKITNIGSLFPLSDFINDNTEEKYLQKNKYTLVEFWYSGCIPCIAQFNSLKSVYKEYKKKGFDIIAISIDGKETMTKYRKVIKLNNYPWKQILDLGGTRATSINIYKYPTNFLLDNNGRIINKDINSTVLDDFLKQKL